MKNKINKTIAILIALILTVSIAIPLVNLPATNAHDPPRETRSTPTLTLHPTISASVKL